MNTEVFQGQVIWSRDWRSVYFALKGTTDYLQIEGLRGNLPLLDCEAFDPGSQPTMDDLLSALPDIRSASWEEEPNGSFPSVELNAFLPSVRIAIIGIAGSDKTISTKERIIEKFNELLQLKNSLLCFDVR